MSSFLKRWWWALLLVAVCLGLVRLRFDVDVLDLLPQDEPTVRGLKLYDNHFTNARELIVTLRAPDAERAESLAGELAARFRQQTNLVEEATWQAPWMESPEQLGELLGWLWFNQPPDAFATLTNRLAPNRLAAQLDQTKMLLATSASPMDLARRSFDPFDLLTMPGLTNFSSLSMGQGQDMFASADGTFRVVYVQSAVDLASYRSCDAWLKSIRAMVDGLRSSESTDDWKGVEVHYTGRPVFVDEIATSMQHDMSFSVVGTSAIIALLFWLTHRRWRPMLWLLALLGLILIATLALGGLVLGTINVISMGFAAVLLGLAVDYAVVHYQEALAHPEMTVPEIRRAIAPSILWAAITTMTAFLVLNLGGLPGLGQLGTLVAIGIGVSALVMVMIYLPPLFPERRQPRPGQPPFRWRSYFIAPHEPPVAARGHPGRSTRESDGRQDIESLPAIGAAAAQSAARRFGKKEPMATSSRAPMLVTGLMVLAAGAVLCFRQPGLDQSGDALQPKRGEAQTTLETMISELGLPAHPLWLIIDGQDEAEVWQRMSAAEPLLDGAVSNHLIGKYVLPDTLWPRGNNQAANRATAKLLGAKGPLLRDAALTAGFNTNAVMLTEELVRTWARAGDSSGVMWPTNHLSQWILKRFVSRPAGECLVMGLVYPTDAHVDPTALTDLTVELAKNGAFLSGWDLLGSAVLKRVEARIWQVVTPMLALVLLSLWLAFRRSREILLGLGMLGLSGLCLLAIMALAGWTWNLMNLMAVPLMLGTGVDYGLFIQLALRRHGGDLVAVRRSVGRALMLCGGTAVAGFGSLALSSNPGMASLGRVCAVGIGVNMLVSVFLLPTWWLLTSGARPSGRFNVQRDEDALNSNNQIPSPQPPPRSGGERETDPGRSPAPPKQPAIYRAGPWKFGLIAVRLLPDGLARGIARAATRFYLLLQRRRVEVVVENFLPVFSGNRVEAERAARAMHLNFAAKLVDLWAIENGKADYNWLTEPGNLEIIHQARQRGNGTLFITLHLGNWEHGGLLLKQHGIRLTILTQAEPDDDLTELRTKTRARYGADTLIIGDGSFAFVEVLKQLQAGADLAVSLDRPPERARAHVEFFGRKFEASLAAAELARASGCALVGVTIVRQPEGFAVKVLPEFVYDRRTLGNPEARRQLTGQILRAFEPEIRQNIEQWYQFTPIWPKAD